MSGMRKRAVLRVLAVLGLIAVSGCTQQQRPTDSGAPTSETTRSAMGSVPPSVAREVPPERRVRLARVSSERMCELVSPSVLDSLAFPVRPGRPREVGVDPPVRGCVFAARDDSGSVLVGTQPGGFADSGAREISLDGVRASKTRHANDCTVLAGVEGATLQVTVTEHGADPGRCESAASVARYALEGLVR
ncbi:hypothetical protein FHX42_004527 [Saccharopolyspora lacisalsi]|uniref:DUF3558 domain-containing protein n=1 Tax=Halosaccharopolyspora lacisalsi TaxID=1000566 RepID=A0A839E1J1_9PSEU|nr:DUF3558 family protein [Halosaccharopolyspora lacisalsi]MBA8827143.1 hypothetical protein [Halosaccharopolyspora lacisalsi]